MLVTIAMGSIRIRTQLLTFWLDICTFYKMSFCTWTGSNIVITTCNIQQVLHTCHIHHWFRCTSLHCLGHRKQIDVVFGILFLPKTWWCLHNVVRYTPLWLCQTLAASVVRYPYKRKQTWLMEKSHTIDHNEGSLNNRIAYYTLSDTCKQFVPIFTVTIAWLQGLNHTVSLLSVLLTNLHTFHFKCQQWYLNIAGETYQGTDPLRLKWWQWQEWCLWTVINWSH